MDPARRYDDYRVEPFGGSTGRTGSATRDADVRYLDVRTCRWPVRRRVVTPAGAINCIDPRRRTLWVEHDRDEVRNGTALDEGRHARRGADVIAK